MTGVALAAEFVDEEPSPAFDAISDEQLLAETQQGIRVAFLLLYRRHFPKARALALNLTRDEDDAAEIVQEAFIRVLCHGASFEGQAAFATWLYRIVYNLAVDRLRRPYRKRTSIEHLEHWLGDLTPLALPTIQPLDPFEATSTLEAGRHILDAIENLPRHHRDVIVLRELRGMSYTEMADALCCSKGTVMSRLFHARQRLQAMLRGLYDEYATSRMHRAADCSSTGCHGEPEVERAQPRAQSVATGSQRVNVVPASGVL